MIAGLNSIDGICSDSDWGNLISSLSGRCLWALLGQQHPAHAVLVMLILTLCLLPGDLGMLLPKPLVDGLKPSMCPVCFASLCNLLQATKLSQPPSSFALLSLCYFVPPLFFPARLPRQRIFKPSTSEIRRTIFSSLFNISPCQTHRCTRVYQHTVKKRQNTDLHRF